MYTRNITHRIYAYYISEMWPSIPPIEHKSSCHIATSNDNWPWNGDDNGKSFGFALGCQTGKVRVDASMNSYTNYISKLSPEQTAFKWTRVDAASISGLYTVWTYDSWSTWTTRLALGWWVAGIGNMRGKDIQDKWHKDGPPAMTSTSWRRYSHDESYEIENTGLFNFYNKNVKTLSWSSLILRARGEYESPILIWDAASGLSVFGSLDMTIPLRRKYAESNLLAEVWVHGQLARLKVDVSMNWYLYRELPLSSVIRAAKNNPDIYLKVRISADAWKSTDTTITPYVEVQRSLDHKIEKWSHFQWVAGVKVSF